MEKKIEGATRSILSNYLMWSKLRDILEKICRRLKTQVLKMVLYIRFSYYIWWISCCQHCYWFLWVLLYLSMLCIKLSFQSECYLTFPVRDFRALILVIRMSVPSGLKYCDFLFRKYQRNCLKDGTSFFYKNYDAYGLERQRSHPSQKVVCVLTQNMFRKERESVLPKTQL